MRRLSSIILLFALSVSLLAQKSPHGDSFKANCDDCHKTDGWKVDLKTVDFNHDGTKFPLVGQHREVNCKDCHTSLEFAKAQTECNSCHTDIHEQTVGSECSRCHTPNSWVVTNITQLHQQGRFPLIGPHTVADCGDCHKNLLSTTSPATPSASLLRFDPLGIECYDCHKDKYLATTAPNHTQSNYSTNCTDCHNMNAFEWKGAGVNHNFFPLTGGHEISDCNKCHSSGVYTGLSNECVTCHQTDYASAANPNHAALSFSTNCKECHTIDPGWKPAEYRDHDAKSFPIYSGKHNGEWNSCSDCHKNAGNYALFTCIDCHPHNNKGETDNEHDGVSGYQYTSDACFACHPSGSSDGSFDHNKSGFPLTGAHTTTACADCHTNGYAGTPNVCASCHINNYNQTTNPNHKIPGGKFSEDCAACHTTAPTWKPATYPTHSNLEGAHIPIANECATCHNGNYTTLPQTCNDCHNADYLQSNSPSHTAAQFPVTCADCHSQAAWKPATFNHDGQYFPIYSGKHNGEWDNCADCHTNPADYKVYTCTSTCHLQPKMDDKHQGVGGYQYNSPACFGCHPDGTAQGFNHASAGFPLTGGHATAVCLDCHASGYSGTSPLCKDCHTPDYNQSANPNHTTLAISNDCATCHTLNPGWTPAAFPTHNNYYVIAGAHIAITNQCADCHNGNYNSTPNTCVGCHQTNYNQTTNPNHTTAQFPITCETCHSQTAWSPSNFDHNTVYPLIGAHATVAANCVLCHANGYSNTPNTCAGCHQTNYDQTTNPNHAAAQFPNTCADCHSQTAWTPATFDHDGQYFPIYSGKHKNEWNACSDCHPNSSNYAVFTCTTACHPQSTMNNEHQGVGGYQYVSSACLACHPNGSAEGAFNHAAFPLDGGHSTVECATCHANGYNNTSTACSSCHTPDYNQTTNPNHAAIGITNECATCHTTNPGWNPATFPTHNNYYVLAGAHIPIANQCAVCHNGNYNSTPNTCAGCHTDNYNQTTDPNHAAAQFPLTCADCHTQSAWTPATFDHDGQYFPIYSGKHNNEWNACSDCHQNSSNYAEFTCTTACHPQSTMNNQHQGVGGYQYVSSACLACHPNGSAEGAFNHAAFPLEGGHSTVECATCHTNGYNNTSAACSSCHTPDYNQTTNPNHTTTGISNECATCHTTNPGWNPATFPTHNNYYVLAGAHIPLANQCAVCHNGNYNNTPNTCSGCHLDNYNQTTNPNHASLQFPTTCETCHSQSAWVPATFDHNTVYPLTGAHATVAGNCALCHANGYNNTPNTCVGCHQTNFNQATNPNHIALGIPNTCATCHTTNPGWEPATFPIHNNYYVLAGAHVAATCAACHNGNYNSTPNTCAGCHMPDYNQTTNPNHASAQFPTTCAECHTQTAWDPSTFNHDAQYFPIYSGKHKNKWNTCSQCHPNASNFAIFTCTTSCHPQNSTNNDHNGVNGYQYLSSACLNCHPNGSSGGKQIERGFIRSN